MVSYASALFNSTWDYSCASPKAKRPSAQFYDQQRNPRQKQPNHFQMLRYRVVKLKTMRTTHTKKHLHKIEVVDYVIYPGIEIFSWDEEAVSSDCIHWQSQKICPQRSIYHVILILNCSNDISRHSAFSAVSLFKTCLIVLDLLYCNF